MKPRTFAGLALLIAAPVGAEPLDQIVTFDHPAGWSLDVGRSEGLKRTVGADEHFGGVEVEVEAMHLHAPTPGGILAVHSVRSRALPRDPDAAASQEVQGVRAGVDAIGTARITGWEIATDPAARVVTGRLEWRDDSLGTTTLSRTLLFRTATAVTRATLDCIIADSAPALRRPCEAALATLAPRGPVADRVPLSISTTPPSEAAGSTAPAVELAIPPPAAPPPSLRAHDGGPLPTTIMVTPPARAPDRRPYYVGAGLALIAAAYWWNRREKSRLPTDSAPRSDRSSEGKS